MVPSFILTLKRFCGTEYTSMHSSNEMHIFKILLGQEKNLILLSVAACFLVLFWFSCFVLFGFFFFPLGLCKNMKIHIIILFLIGNYVHVDHI